MPISPLAGRPAPENLLIDIAGLERDYFSRKPDSKDPTQLYAESFRSEAHLQEIVAQAQFEIARAGRD